MKAFLLLLICSSAFAISEESYERIWNSEVLVHFQDLQQGEFTNAQGLKIRYRYQVHTKALRTLVILPGRTEAMIKYAELMFDLHSPNVNIFIMDHQGQGESERLVTLDGSHVRRFSDYVNDFRQFMRQVVIPTSGDTERMLLAHSMGGAIAVHYLHAAPTAFSKAVLAAPMLKIVTAPYSELVALWYARILSLAGKGDEYAPGQGPYLPDTDTFESNLSTQSKVRFDYGKRFWLENSQLIVGGPTASWVKENIKGSKKSIKLAAQIKTPMLIFQAGQDQIVVNSRQNTFCTRAPQCQITLLTNARHGLLNEKDEIRNKVIERIQSFLEL